jgi:periplasmic copper chaperone A
MRRLAAAVTTTMVAATAGGGAFAHVTVDPREAMADGYARLAFSVSHGCDGSSTVAVRIRIPDGVLSVKPQMKPGWTVDIKTRTLEGDLPSLHGKTITETVDEVAWRGGPLPDNLYDTFGLSMKLPDRPGKSLYFPVVQECDKGVHRWIEIPAAGQRSDDLREPAPTVRLKSKAP